MAFYIPFILVFKRTTFFTVNRMYLLSGLLLSFILPLYTGFSAMAPDLSPDLPFMEPLVTQAELVISRATEPAASSKAIALVVIFYLAGLTIRLIRLTFSITALLKLIGRGETSVHGNLKVVRADIRVPFSFLNRVVLPKGIVGRGILDHEAAHVRQGHWLDLLIVELASTILWFNPLMIFYKRSLKQQHEYLADRSAINSGIDIGPYLARIGPQVGLAVPSALISEFYFQSIKNRINMLTKRRTSVFGLSAYALVLPVIICLLMAFSSHERLAVIAPAGANSVDAQISLGLPIDKQYDFAQATGYGERMHPVLHVMRLHSGIDFIAKEGVPVVAAGGGVVVKAMLASNWGNIDVVRHDGIYSTSYSHLKSMDVKVGDRVQQGQVIGQVGHTGLSSQDHLHFELLENGKAVDPAGYLPK
jgi:murein DD-endopeptidase MepM/ murein hydrolase activator NlpD